MKQDKAYVVGSGAKKSLSPTIFNYWFNKYNIKGIYLPKEIKERLFENQILKILNEKSLCGLNITIPYKAKIIPHLNTTDQHSIDIGAVNCVTKNKNALIGTNTDWVGFKTSLNWFIKKNKIKTKKNTAIVLGYGGSAKAIIYSLTKLNYKKIKVFNRSFNKIKNDKRISPFRLIELSKHLYTADIIINTIPATKTKQQHIFDMLDAVHKFGKLESIGYDIVYNQETNFLNNFKSSHRIHGTLMLIHQAAPCFKKWFKIAPKIDNKIVKKLLQQTKKKQ